MSGSLWYQDPIFNRYWKHYYGTLDWFHQHKQILRELEQNTQFPPSRTPYSPPFRGTCSPPKTKRKRHLSGSPVPPPSDITSVSDDEELEITEEVIAFFEQSEKHRQELKAAREARRAEEDRASSRDAKESGGGKRPFAGMAAASDHRRRRTAEMKQLYGEAAAMIHGMETAMQLSYNRFCDQQQPKHWPNIPLKL